MLCYRFLRSPTKVSMPSEEEASKDADLSQEKFSIEEVRSEIFLFYELKSQVK